MSKALSTVAGLCMIAFAACGPAEPPTPTPDVPRFASGEAIAVVKEWIGHKTFIPNPRLSCRNVTEGTMVWSESYLGTGVWSVTAVPGEGLANAVEAYAKLADSEPRLAGLLAVLSEGGEWQVYEYTGRVVSMRQSYPDVACR